MRFLPITSKLLPLLSSTIDSKIPPPSDWTTSECTFAIISRAREKQYKEKFFRGSFVRIIKINSQLLCRVFFFFFFSSTATKKSERLWCQTGSFEGRRCPHFAGPLVRGGWKRGTGPPTVGCTKTIPQVGKKGAAEGCTKYLFGGRQKNNDKKDSRSHLQVAPDHESPHLGCRSTKSGG